MKTYMNTNLEALKRLIFSVASAILITALSCTALQADEWNGPSDWAKFDVAERRAMWVWNPIPTEGGKEENRSWDGDRNVSERFYQNYKGSMDLFFDFCENKSIRVLYMSCGSYQWTDYSSGGLDYAEEYMIPFLEEANARGIQVWYMYVLNDDRDSATLVKNTNQIITIAKAVHNFNQEFPSCRFAGIHCDQEPNDTSVYTGLLENTKRAYDWIEESGSDLLTSQALRPAWRNASITFNGETKVMNQHMQDWLHHSALMAYNSNANKVYDWAKLVIDYADSIGRSAAIGSEVANLNGAWDGSENETWYGKLVNENAATRFQVSSSSPVTWEDMMHTTVDKFKDNPSFDRMAIHSYGEYFWHWFRKQPRDYLLELEGGEYVSSAINPDKVDLTVDALPLFGHKPVPFDNRHPVVVTGEDRYVFDSDRKDGEMVELDGSGSTDDFGISEYVWSIDGEEIARGAKATVFLADGTHEITLTLTDTGGLSLSRGVTISVMPAGEVLFSEDFETATPGFDQLDPAKGWVQVGSNQPEHVGIGDYGPDGSQAVSLSAKKGWIYKAIDTSGWESIMVSFDLRLEGYANEKNLVCKYSKTGLTESKHWTTVKAFDSTHTEYDRYTLVLPAAAANNPNFIFNFHSVGNDGVKTDISFIDNIVLTGVRMEGYDHGSGSDESHMQVVGAEFSLTGSGGTSGANDSVTLKWGSAVSGSYSIWSSVDLINWTEEVSDIPSAGEMTAQEFTPSQVASDKRFFQIREN
ncbi:PKD domain-containing protein [Persicirhabdus sediminis]|uniref:PKD domain-containing protein n=1 Tax=Persicirhabdus sediminis TaxID=454144 RepID=A0A8J7ME12_9BACT|nr:PKD domain-containing protein [Persicirhabdus sediminis]MBK1792144.1 PKD domain-containing protein [Persicirhabdus sediminis]